MTPIQKLRSRLRKSLPWREEEAWLYNLRVGRSVRQVTRELAAMASLRPLYIGLVEAMGYDLPELDGYRLTRDTSTKSRANVALYVREDQASDRAAWRDLTRTWKRTERAGMHEPRSILVDWAGGIQVVVAHAAPRTRYRDTLPAQEEMLEALFLILEPRARDGWKKRSTRSRVIANLRPRHLVWDANRRPGESGPGPTLLAELVEGQVAGSRIDGAVLVNTQLLAASYPTEVAGVELKSDHGCAFRFRFRVWGSWSK